MNDTLTLHSSIKPEYIKRAIYRGTFLAFLGLLPMFYGGLYLDAPSLSVWGAPIFFGAMALIALGLVPYRRMASLEKHPHKLLIENGFGITFYRKGKKTLVIPFESLKGMSFIETKNDYGIALFLKSEPVKKILVHDHGFDFRRYQEVCRKRNHGDLFLPNFTRKAYNELKEIITGHCSVA